MSAARRCWLATAIDVPIYAALALTLSWPAREALALLDPGSGVDERMARELFAAATNVAIVLFGSAIVAHTVGRLLDSQMRRVPTGRAAVAFAAMGGVLALLPTAVLALGQGDPVAGAVYGIIGIVSPAALTAATTHLLIGTVAASRTRIRAVVIAAGAAWLATIGWTAAVVWPF